MMIKIIPTEVISTSVINIEAEDLGKNYDNIEALKDISFNVKGPGILGIIGPNGAGKTTLLKILNGYHAPSVGWARINGLSVEEKYRSVKEQIGYLPENNPLYTDMSALEYLEFIADAHLIRGEEKKNAVNKAVSISGLGTFANKKIETLSKGYRQRTGIAAALVHNPPILILDEPCSGLDPNQIVEMRTLIAELGKTKLLILSTHILHEAENLCSVIVILNNGRIQAKGTIEEIAESLGITGRKPNLEELFLKLTAGEHTTESNDDA